MNKNWQKIDSYIQRHDGTTAEIWWFSKPGVTLTIWDTEDNGIRCEVNCAGKDFYSVQDSVELAISWCITTATTRLADLSTLILENAQ